MVFLNRYVLGSADIPLQAPVFVTWLQCAIGVVLIGLLGMLNTLRIHPVFEIFPSFQAQPALMRKVMPLSLAFMGMITFNNLCLLYVGVAFYNVGRSLTTVFNVLLTYAVLRTVVSTKTLLMCGVIVLGFLLGVDQEEASHADADRPFSVVGVIFGGLASFCVAVNAVLTQTLVTDMKDPWLLSYYNNLNAALLMVPLIPLTGEINQILEHQWLLATPYFWAVNLLAAVFGMAIGLATMWQIKYTSSLTHNVSGTAKASAQTVIAVMWTDAHKPFFWWVSNALVLAGSFGYAYVKTEEMAQRDRDRAVLPVSADKPDKK
jgi:GDP-fucose transporter C1